MRWPTVRMILQPPSAVPAVSATAQARNRPGRGGGGVGSCQHPSSSAAITPIALLSVIGPVAEGEGRGHRPLAGSHGSRPSARVGVGAPGGAPHGSPPTPPRATHDRSRPPGQSRLRRPPTGASRLDAAPVDGIDASLCQGSSDQPPDKGVPGSSRAARASTRSGSR